MEKMKTNLCGRSKASRHGEYRHSLWNTSNHNISQGILADAMTDCKNWRPKTDEDTVRQ